MKVYFCSGCPKLWKPEDLKPIATRNQLKYLAAFQKKFPNREPLGACPKCGRPVCDFPDIFQPAETSVPAETSMAAFNPDGMREGARTVLARLLELRKKGRLGETRDETIAHLGQRYNGVTKTLSLLMRAGVVARTIVQIKNPDTGKMNCVYAACPEMIQAIKDQIFPEDFKRIRDDNLSLKIQQKALIALEEKRNKDLEQLRRKCYAHYGGEAPVDPDEEANDQWMTP